MPTADLHPAPAGRRLVRLSEGCRLIAEARSVDELKEIRDRAEALRHLARERQLGLQAQNDAAEIKVRAERRMGELLRQMPKQGPGQYQRSQRATVAPALRDLGLTKSDSSRWQRLAAIDEGAFEGHIGEARQAGREITTAGLLRLHKALSQHGRADAPPLDGGCTVEDLDALTRQGRKFRAILADPPWRYDNRATRGAAEDHYSTMTVEQIAALPVAQLAADSAHCHLWATNGFLHEALHILEGWGFAFRSCFVWRKPTIGTGNYWRLNHEFLLLGVRGSCPFRDKSLASCVTLERGEHSAKPEDIRAMIERASPGPYVELFGRRAVEGWAVWGNEVERDLFTRNIPSLTATDEKEPPP